MRSNNTALNRMVQTQAHQHQQMAPEYGHYGQMAAPPQVQPMTLDDVVVRTAGLLVLTGAAGALTWFLTDVNPAAAQGLMFLGMIITLGAMLASWIGSGRLFANPVVPSLYAGGAGLMLGGISYAYETAYTGIVMQAVIATFGTFFGMALLFKAKVVRNSPRFTKFMVGAGIGIMGLLVINLVMSLFGVNLGLFNNGDGDVTLIQWGIALFFVGWGAFSFILDFDMVQESVRYGAPKKMAWVAAFGMVAGLIFLYLSILRLLSYLRQ
ncbi:putative YccA/Bax inhibitor family protein [Stackebrandtia albiflava]|uniref:Putative YccA/Bax inhibitor family protein n=1 Tax=Stackebrandtia albiflava TaxID=406432 RepID=A0A562V4K0_9ACTN|nr:Bax inhibitor-1/YccA family protein [Stackebrandtia albiflava]TWJ12819.1 putative YccA/Bax inhibitor family protein [Stackebrandtia albiflava]